MKKVKITVVKRLFLEDVAKAYANPRLGICNYQKEGMVFYSDGWQKPDGLCDNAWKSMMEYVMTLAHGGRNFYGGGWIKDENTAIIACNDGIRPVIYKIEPAEE